MSDIDTECAMLSFHEEYKDLGVKIEGTDQHEYGKRHLHIYEPTLLAALVAYCSGRRQQVFLRGSTENHPFSVPSLFRDKSRHGAAHCRDKCIRLWDAYPMVLASLRRKLAPNNSKSRWRRRNLGAVLQHYGIKTPWLDVVRNLHTAIWFATHKLESDRKTWRSVLGKSDGWISLYARRRASLNPWVVGDLWGEQSSKHLRPHAQQGLSFAMQDDHAPCPSEEQDFNHYRIAHVRLPNTTAWGLRGPVFTPAFLFPPDTQDSSLKELTEIQGILDETRTSNGLDPDTLGRITHYT